MKGNPDETSYMGQFAKMRTPREVKKIPFAKIKANFKS